MLFHVIVYNGMQLKWMHLFLAPFLRRKCEQAKVEMKKYFHINKKNIKKDYANIFSG